MSSNQTYLATHVKQSRIPNRILWRTISFGKYVGKTIPQLIFTDPDYFFWAMETGVFRGKGSLTSQAECLLQRARAIRIPEGHYGQFMAEYLLHPGVRGCCGLEIVPATRPEHQGSTRTVRKPVIDMGFPRRVAQYDKQGYRHFLGCLKFILFDDEDYRMTRERCEKFFSNPDNFVSSEKNRSPIKSIPK
jgi:hypothetical protein